MSENVPSADGGPKDFVRDVIREDIAAGRVKNVVTRFPGGSRLAFLLSPTAISISDMPSRSA